MTTRAKPVLLCGYYGEHNLGDDALLEVLLDQLPAGTPVLVTAHDQAQVQQRFGVATANRRSLAAVLAALGRCRALVLGGGSLLQDATSFKSLLYYGALIVAARLQGKAVVLWGQGLGPLCRRRSRLLVRALLPLATAIGWRDADSARLGASLGRAANHHADPVWASQASPWRGQGGPVVVCFRPTPLLRDGAWRPYLEALGQLAQSANREVIWLPFHGEQDRALLQDLAAQGLLPQDLQQRSRQVLALTPSQAKAVFNGAGLVLAMRLHGLILAAVSGAPVAALSYDPKVAAAAAALGCPCQGLGEPVQSAALTALWQAQLDRPPAASQLAALRQQAQQQQALLRML
ncbi:MAG: polysaccharide pyruvyl transferase CsaB [Cyanobacteriota bacterium]|nr:polysaccharide pyruvyl transferase CsaB [Cyanobacteriota bacterium]